MTTTRIHASYRGEVMLMGCAPTPPADDCDKAKPGIQSVYRQYRLWMNLNPIFVGEAAEPNHVYVVPISLSPHSMPSLPLRAAGSTKHTASAALRSIATCDEQHRVSKEHEHADADAGHPNLLSEGALLLPEPAGISSPDISITARTVW